MAFKRNNFNSLVNQAQKNREELKNLLYLNSFSFDDDEWRVEQVKVINIISWVLLQYIEKGELMISNDNLKLIFNYWEKIKKQVEEWANAKIGSS